MANWARRSDRRRNRRRPNRAAQLVILGVAAVLAVFAYFKNRDRKLPRVIAGSASVIDGDTVRIGGTHIRLQGIDAPEWEQARNDANGAAWPCGRQATSRLAALIHGRELTCETSGYDQYDRVLAVCSLPDEANVNVWLVRQGWAVAFGRSRLYATAEAEARAAKRGIWQGTFTRPSEWRAGKAE